MNASFAAVNVSFAAVNASFAAVNASFAAVNTSFAAVNASFTAFGQVFAELLDAVPTRVSAARISKCARASTWYLDAPPKVCTAFAYQRHAAAPRVFVSASHCITNRKVGDSVALFRLGDAAPTSLNCSIQLLTASPDDTLILACPDAGDAPSYRASHSSLGSAAAAAGFALDSYAGGTPFHITDHVALHIRFSKQSNSAGRGLVNGTCVIPSSDEDASARSWIVEPAGFLDEAVANGMSGGPVLDTQCGVFGIIQGASCGASVYINLSTVDAYVAQHPAVDAYVAQHPD